MNDYIILNGVRSTLIRGLMICKLPPITKPPLRTQTVTIDGRDGDIVTPLGYGSYKKDIEIGLYGDYDVDEVIKYFNSSGTVTFSNEITKYYNYRIDDQIDFEKLIRFRTAKITMTVQPFKYATDQPTAVYGKDRTLQSVINGTIVKNGLGVLSGGDEFCFSLIGRATVATELYIPITPVIKNAGEYVLTIKTNSASRNADSVKFRLIGDVPTNDNSFGGTLTGYEISLGDDQTFYMYNTIAGGTKSYNFIYLYVEPGASINTQVTAGISRGDNCISSTVRNGGNYFARPTIRIKGAGTNCIFFNQMYITNPVVAKTAAAMTDHNKPYVYIGDENGYIYGGRYIWNSDSSAWQYVDQYRNFLVLELGTAFITDPLIINSTEQEAYDKNGVLKNRIVKGDYSRITLPPGVNGITATPGITEVDVDLYSRWT